MSTWSTVEQVSRYHCDTVSTPEWQWTEGVVYGMPDEPPRFAAERALADAELCKALLRSVRN